MIEVKNITKKYGSFTAVDNISFKIEEGEIIGLLGPNGAGKSTAIKLILGLCRADEGSIRVFGHESKELPETLRQEIGVSLAESGFSGELTVNDVKHILKKMYYSFDENYFIKQSENLKLPMNKKIKELSGGMRQRLGIAQAILNDPKILILDEPTAGLDPGERIRFRNIISNIAKNRMVLISTHIVSDIEYIANQVVILQEGKLNRMGTVEGLCNDIQGSVWKVNVDEMTAEELMKNYLTSNIKRVDENVLMRIISKNKPIKNARMSEPQLEDVFLTVFCEQAGI